MKCPFRVITTIHKLENGEKEMMQEFAECLGEECAAANIVEHSLGGGKWEPEIVGCKRLMSQSVYNTCILLRAGGETE